MIPHMSALMSKLFERAEGRLTLEELEAIAQLSANGADAARRLAAVCEGIACLVTADQNKPIRAGNFQEPDAVFDLLCMLSHGLDTVAGMVEIGSAAEFKVRQLREGGTE